MRRGAPTDEQEDLVTNGGTVLPLDSAAIDGLCERLNTEAPTFAELVKHFAAAEVPEGLVGDDDEEVDNNG